MYCNRRLRVVRLSRDCGNALSRGRTFHPAQDGPPGVAISSTNGVSAEIRGRGTLCDTVLFMATRRGACLCFCMAAHLLAQAPVRKIRQKMTDTLNSTPDFVCAVSIDRTEKIGKGAPAALPPLHVNAGIINGKELYALPPSEDGQNLLRQILAVYSRAGMGSFAMFARAVFTTSDATFYDGPDESKDGRTLARLDFAMPREVSNYALNNAGQAVELGYSGSIWTDPHNQEVARLMVQADGIPTDLGIRAVTQTIEYGHSSILGLSVLLPTSTALVLQEVSGRELRVTERLSDCHQYNSKRGEQFVENRLEAPVTVTAESVAAGSGSPGTVARAIQALPSLEELLPVKTLFEMMLEDSLDERTITAGSKLAFTVSRDVKKDGKIVLPVGAKAMGHVTRILRQTYILNTSEKGYYAVGLQLDTLEAGGRHYLVSANLERVGPPAAEICFVPFSHNPLKWGQYDDIYQLFMIPNPASRESFLGVVSEFLRLGNHWRTYWTVAHQGP